MDPSPPLEDLLAVCVAHADYAAARGRAVRVWLPGSPASVATGVLREVGARQCAGGFESFALEFAVRDAAAAQGLYAVDIEGLPSHALLLVPFGRADGTSAYHASFNRRLD